MVADVIAACAIHVPLPRIPAHVVVLRHGQRLREPQSPAPSTPSTPSTTSTTTSSTASVLTTSPAVGRTLPLFLAQGDQIEVSHGGVLRFAYAGNRYLVSDARVALACRELAVGSDGSQIGVLAVRLQSGRVAVHAGSTERRGTVLTPEMLTFAALRDSNFVVDRDPAARRTTSWSLDRPIIAARASGQALRINARMTYTAISDDRGLRLDIWPFSISRWQRAPGPADGLPAFWDDGRACSIGCSAPGVTPGWPIRPFHYQHAIRAGINELRPANFHVAVDIEANDFQPVYAIQSGVASARPTGSVGDFEVTVGRFTYFHIVPTVSRGQYVVAYKTRIGAVEHGFGHLALQEGGEGNYLNPLRPGGSLRPYRDSEAPIIGTPHVFPDGHVNVGAFDPQSFIHKEGYETPVLAPSSLAWRLYTAAGRPLTRLEWAMRGTGYISPALKPVIFAPGASNPGFECFFTHLRCIPNWVYNLAGGLTERLPLTGLPRGRYRLTVYAWDWAGNESALDDWIKLPLAAPASARLGGLGGVATEFGPLHPRFDP